jgi:hypothetical protein
VVALAGATVERWWRPLVNLRLLPGLGGASASTTGVMNKPSVLVNDSIVVRQFYRTVPAENAPDDPTLIRWANQIGGQDPRITLQAGAMELGLSLKVTRGGEMCVDPMVIESNIHHPSDSASLGDGVKVLKVILHPSEVLPHSPRLNMPPLNGPFLSYGDVTAIVHR